MELTVAAGAALLAAACARRVYHRLRLSHAKHPSLTGHAKMARRVTGLIPYYEFEGDEFFAADGAPEEVTRLRRLAFAQLAQQLRSKSPATVRTQDPIGDALSDLNFTSNYRVPFPFRAKARRELTIPAVVSRTDGPYLYDVDGNQFLDLSGAYGVNLMGYDFYKSCLRRAADEAEHIGPVLGPYHPVVAENVQRLREISGKDEVSFHMSGTEAVMQAVALARYHTGKRYVVRFCGAYHGWWDGVQPGPGNPRRTDDVYTLREMHEATLRVLKTRNDIACVLVNPIQGMHPNGAPPSDATLINSSRTVRFDREAYGKWLNGVARVCRERGIIFIVDDIFTGFRLAWGGAQEYFSLDADLVTYGKTLGGGLPVGVLCGRSALMRRFEPDFPGRVCFASGTFNPHPQVMLAMHAFLSAMDDASIRPDYAALDRTWIERADTFNQRLQSAGVPVRVANMSSVFSVLYDTPSRYNWMYQFYLRDAGVNLSWVGTGRLIFTHNCTDAVLDDAVSRFVRAGRRMAADGWWTTPAGLTNKAIGRQMASEILSALWSQARGRRHSSIGTELGASGGIQHSKRREVQ